MPHMAGVNDTPGPLPEGALARHPLFAGAEPASLARAAAAARLREYAAGETVLDFDCPSTELRLVLRGGPLRVLMRAAGGREKIVAEAGPGGFVGELAALAGPAAAPSAGIRAVHRTLLAVLPGAALLDVLDHSPAVSRRLLALFAERIRAQNRRLLEYAALPARHRLCAELLRLARPRAGGEGGLVISPPPSRPELAARIGARREAVSRELAALAREGRLALTPRALVLLDEAALRAEVAAGMEAAKRLA